MGFNAFHFRTQRVDLVEQILRLLCPQLRELDNHGCERINAVAAVAIKFCCDFLVKTTKSCARRWMLDGEASGRLLSGTSEIRCFPSKFVCLLDNLLVLQGSSAASTWTENEAEKDLLQKFKRPLHATEQMASPFRVLLFLDSNQSSTFALHPLNEADFGVPTDVAKEPVKQNLDQAADRIPVNGRRPDMDIGFKQLLNYDWQVIFVDALSPLAADFAIGDVVNAVVSQNKFFNFSPRFSSPF